MKTIGMNLVTISMIAFVSAGCATSISQQITSLHVDCKTEDMQIFNERVALRTQDQITYET